MGAGGHAFPSQERSQTCQSLQVVTVATVTARSDGAVPRHDCLAWPRSTLSLAVSVSAGHRAGGLTCLALPSPWHFPLPV